MTPTPGRHGRGHVPTAAQLLVAVLLAASTGCSVTWRQPSIAPLDPVNVYPVAGTRACEAIAGVLADLGLSVNEVMASDSACVLETGYLRLDAPGDPFERLRDVGYVAAADAFTHGRYLLTATVRENGDGNARVRLAARLEGYDAGYRTVRSNGTIEGETFTRLAARLGSEPLTPNQ